MSSYLSKIKRGVAQLPPRVLLLGQQGIGKTTLASKAPNPLFVAAEDGLTGFDQIPRFSPGSIAEHDEFLNGLEADNSQGFRTLVYDTADWFERLVHTHICRRDNYPDIEAYGGGWGKGDKIASVEMVRILSQLERIREKHLMGIIFLSHVSIKTFSPPGGEPYDRYQPKGGKQFSGVLTEWVDAVLYATYETYVLNKDKKNEKVVGGDRVIHTTWQPAWDAKNRYSLPDPISMEWDDFARAVEENSVPNLCKKIRELYATAKIPQAETERWAKAMGKIESLSADKLKSAIEALTKLQ